MQLKVPTPKIGTASVRLVTIKVKAPHGQKVPKLKLNVTNLGALGKGFGGVAVVHEPKSPGSTATFEVFLVLFMGNLSSAPAGTIDIQTNMPAGETKTTTKDETKDCATINSIYELDRAGVALALLHLSDDPSPPRGFVNSTTSFLCPK